ncbi:Cation-independent mannose-6-phosphate receptor CI-MPR [Orbilia oligospora]|uniref:Cation-independent mannose-6-phosphate receptor CI-MPR n=1 Tax=Orbilia oligospora TaxID=2813651 RepID=A0A7C8IWG4_ORBOL|nr:Cation-independent mannose-6-phosphate receptor CI-MPR [Orbilia oligospora]KAF3080849.1 Cation-independent mannose-6-phosphate receptor CI-MPR [Orbilia oligospora]
MWRPGGSRTSNFLASASIIAAALLIGLSQANPLAVLSELPDPPCSATSNRTGTFVDLHSLIRKGHDDNYLVSGYDYNSNFTLNICAPVLSSDNLDFHALSDAHNISAFYQKGGITYSLGRASSTPKFRGRKLILEYTGGSLCPKLDSNGAPVDGKDNEDGYRKGALLSFTCDRELIGPARVSFVGQQNECSYWFDVRTSSACATVKQQPLGPVAIFGIIFLVALLVYFIGGCFYQRTVLHARGWRQVPHWQTWLGALNFIWDAIRICMFSVTTLCGRAGGRGRTGRFGGYAPASGEGGGFGRASFGAGADEWVDGEDENRLIDQLDDEWSDG